MALDQGDCLSLLALIVAVVALMISSWQLAQQLFATATDGKRFWQASVMGIWSRKTRLSWRWSQVRFETKYTTPEIRLSIPLVGWLTEVFNGPASDWIDYFEITLDRHNVPLELQKTRRPGVEILARSHAEEWSLWLFGVWDSSYKNASPDIVSWPSLLRRVYLNQSHSIKKAKGVSANGSNQKVGSKQLEDGKADSDSEEPYPEITDQEREQGEDRVVVRLVERSWDLIPPDVVRPMAHSNVGTMVVIAHRLGMSWLDEFSPSDGKMNAAGCGHTFTSETVRGLGTVIRYDYHEESKKIKNALGSRRGISHRNYLSPTETADQLHCGIVPVDADALPTRAAQEDIALINAARIVDMAAFVDRLGVPLPESDILRDKQRHDKKKDDKQGHNSHGAPGRALKHSMEEAISMLCPIPTLPQSSARCIIWPVRNMRQPFTPTRQRSGLQELRDQLFEYVSSHKQLARIMEHRKDTLLEKLQRSPLEYLDELLEAGKWLAEHRSSPSIDDAQHACKLYTRIRQIHRQTSDVFAAIEPETTSDEEDARPFLVNLVGAHVTLATRHGKTADDIAMNDNSNSGNNTKPLEKDTRDRFVEELVRLYAQDLDSPDNKTIRKHPWRAGYTNLMKPGEVPALWWTLVVRSACWWMSVKIKLPETQIPSHWYNSQTPVYIT
ncbi:hypothetical protein LTR37_014996 [Vermiconidia calcicola]|uniref:Uncharacterized protein n=1 Tax=Vermiconidia calcicola TaxID=1690605 RepID=A0ACC3MS37_9PEZI|nr:hypothetical protein LTR37_014996 [Vermiconidia calcicola]